MSDRQESSDEINLANIDYDDVLHLYRGWRKAEGALKDKKKELSTLKSRVKQLQESHIKFRGQIQALESVKELTISLQTQLSVLQQENIQLGKENNELAQLNTQAEELLKERLASESAQSRLLHSIQIEFATLRGRYEEMAISQKELEALAADEQAMRMAAEARLNSCESALQTLRTDNKTLKSKAESTSIRLSQSDHQLSHASDQLRNLALEVADISETKVTSCVNFCILLGFSFDVYIVHRKTL